MISTAIYSTTLSHLKWGDFFVDLFLYFDTLYVRHAVCHKIENMKNAKERITDLFTHADAVVENQRVWWNTNAVFVGSIAYGFALLLMVFLNGGTALFEGIDQSWLNGAFAVFGLMFLGVAFLLGLRRREIRQESRELIAQQNEYMTDWVLVMNDLMVYRSQLNGLAKGSSLTDLQQEAVEFFLAVSVPTDTNILPSSTAGVQDGRKLLDTLTPEHFDALKEFRAQLMVNGEG